ncbi:MMPL family transporter [Natronococcus sp. A-GB7]|uniref:MMPL family transporter n=1 Tax=Natronococcus sp. A-GB7 TaxID=3037649 RepID=UPI00241C67F9|nr:MMPL family transporter [Natronococcus sp. A-GB7]MDG5821091.1 MMPL family transporter [Natronococcus sp. A-GB7]
MSLPYRLSELITSYSKIVIVALLLTTALVGAGMPMVDDDSSLDQFEGESAEAEALEEMDDNFAADGDENTTSVQLIHRDEGGNVLSQESLITSLEFQQEIRDNESINATLADDDPITGVENILAITAITNEEIDELEERGEELEDREAELENRSDVLEEGLDEVLELQREYEEASADGDEATADELEAEIEATVDGTVDEAELDADQADEYEAFVEDAREVETNRWTLERQAELPPEELPEYQELEEALDEVYTGATVGVLAEEFEALEEDAAALEEEQQELEQRGEELEEREAALEQRSETLEDGLEEALAIQRGALNEGGDAAVAEVDDEIDATVEAAATEAELDAEQTAEYEEFVDQALGIDATRWGIEQASDDPENAPGYQELTQNLEEVTLGATVGVLEDEYAQLEADAATLEADGQELEEDGQELEQRESELDDRATTLEEGLDEVLDLQREYEAAAEAGDDAEAEEIEAEIEATIENAAAEAQLDAEQTDQYEELAEQAREIESNRWTIEQRPDDPEEIPEYQELNEALEGIYAGATMGVLEEEYEQLGDDAEALEEAWDEFEEDDETPSLDEQIEALEGLDDEEFEDLIREVLDEDDDGNEGAALGFMPSDYEPGSTEADARMTLVSQETAGGDDMEMGGEMDATLETQLDLRELATQHEQEYVVFGAGIITDEIENSMGDSLAIVGPLALLFVVGALAIAYRDPLDIVMGVVGIGGVLIWTFGFMGWAGIAFNQMMIAVPVLLIGLSIDYAIHVFMRHREQREADGETSTVRGSMTIALAGVGVALVWVTATTAIGFLANLVSPIAPIQEFGIVSAFGIVAALIIFGGLIPALKVEIDSLLESRGWDRRKRAFGTREGGFTSALTVGSEAARKIPVIVLIAALLLTAGGVYGATQVDTSFEEEDFLAESPPGWTEHLPGPMAPGEYQAADDLEYINDNFQREDTQAQILVEGDITDDGALQRLEQTQSEAADSDVVYTLPNGEADVRGPLSVMEDTAAENESFNESFQAADTNGDGVPDQNVEALYDELFEVNEDEASSVIYRTDGGEYESARLIVATDGGANVGDVTTELRSIAGELDAAGTGDERNLDAGEGELNAFATGDPIVNYIVEQDLLETVLQSLMITLVAVFAFLTVAYKLTGNSATLGAVTLLPVAFAVSWILGTMYLLGMPFNVLTGMITSLTIGLGVAYSIHVSARYTLELERQGNVWSAMRTTVTGTGGALLGSAATTVGGFGTLAFAILPALRQFGIITGMTIIYSFLASVIVLPTLLVLWTRYFGPDVSFDRSRAGATTPAASDGGTEMETDTSPEHAGEDEP